MFVCAVGARFRCRPTQDKKHNVSSVDVVTVVAVVVAAAVCLGVDVSVVVVSLSRLLLCRCWDWSRCLPLVVVVVVVVAKTDHRGPPQHDRTMIPSSRPSLRPSIGSACAGYSVVVQPLIGFRELRTAVS